MLTVKEINEISFGKAGFSGYKPEDVDNFIDEVVESFQQLQGERDTARKQADDLAAQNAALAAKNAEFQGKLAVLAEKIESYREDEDGIKDALLSAQRMAKDSIREAKDKAAVILQDAEDSAKKMMDEAKVEAAKAAREYMAQAEAKKAELEEIKRQVTAFRSSLLEMYKKHLECINHIPVFRQKETEEPTSEEEREDPVPEQPAPVEEPIAVEEEPAEELAPAVQEEPEPQPVPPQPVEQPAYTQSYEPTLHDKVDYSQEQLQPVDVGEEAYLDDDLSDVGIDLKTYSNIPETLQREKSSHFSNLEFGDGVDVGRKSGKKRRK